LEAQAIPAFRAPAFGDATSLQHEMPAAALAEHVTEREASLAAADYQRLYLLNRHDSKFLPRRAPSKAT
jgi:hypothetical protein